MSLDGSACSECLPVVTFDFDPPQSTDLGLDPDLLCGVRAGSLRTPEPRPRAETRGRKRKNADVQKKQIV